MLERLITETAHHRARPAAYVCDVASCSGVQPHVVQQRCGHESILTTLDLYAQVLPSQQADAASTLAALLY